VYRENESFLKDSDIGGKAKAVLSSLLARASALHQSDSSEGLLENRVKS
jgi:hypothetical protein